MDINSFSQVLGGFQSEENATRKIAESTFNNFRDENPNGAILLVLEILKTNPNEKLRLQAALLVKNLFGGAFYLKNSKNIWPSLVPETQLFVKSTLISLLDTETSNLVRNNLCESISDLARDLIPEGAWPEISQTLFCMVNSDNVAHQKSGLRIIGELTSTIVSDLSENPKAVSQIVSKCISSPDPYVRFECMGFITNIVEDDNKNVWKHLVDAIPIMMQSLTMMIDSNFDSSCEALQCIIRIIESNVLFFKPHIALVVEQLINLVNNESINEEYRQYSVEALVCFAETKPKLALKVPNFVARIVDVLMKFMLEIKEEKYTEWLDSGDEAEDDEQRNYDIGEEGMDRIAKAFSELPNGGDVITTTYNIVGQFLARSEWQFRFVGIMVMSQTVEYLPEDSVEEHLEHIMKILLQHLEDPDRHVRFASCQAIGQVSLDHQPYVQEKFYNDVFPPLIKAMNDTHHRVQSHATAAFVNFAEEVEKPNLLPYVDALMPKLLSRINSQTKALVREQAITAVAVVAAVIENHFGKYYSTVMPIMKNVIQNCLSVQDRICRGKAIECMSIIGLSVGKELFAQDEKDVMNALLQIASTHFEDDDPVKEYLQEALGRMCRVLGDDFVVYLPHIMPGILQVLSSEPAAIEDDSSKDDDDMTMAMIAGDKCIGLKTSMIQEQEKALDLISTYVEILGAKFHEWISPVTAAILPLLSYILSDDVKQKALNTMAELMEAARLANEMTNGNKSFLQAMLTNAVNVIFRNLHEGNDRIDTDLDVMVAEASGINECIQKAGPGLLTDQIIREYSEQVFKLLQQSSERRAQYALKKASNDIDEEDIESIEEEEEQEQTLRTSLLEILGALMRHHPNEFMSAAASPCIEFIHTYSKPTCSPDDRSLALFVCDDLLMQLKDLAVPLWDQFMDNMLNSINDPNPTVRQAACFGICQAALIAAFSRYADSAATRLVSVINHPSATKGKENTLATDNAVAALGDLIFRCGSSISNAECYFSIWLNYLPLKLDEEEGQRVHSELVQLVQSNSPIVLGAQNKNVPKIVGILASIYKTEFSQPATDENIRNMINHLGNQYLVTIGDTLSKKQQRKLERILRDIQTNQNTISAA